MEPESAQLSAAQRGKVRRLSQPREVAPDEAGGELNIIPFLDIIVNILIFVLATVSVTFTATITTTPPGSKGTGVRANIESAALGLVVMIVNDGFSIKAAGGNVASGCQDRGSGIAVPKLNGKYDYPALTKCVARLKHSNPDFNDEHQAYVAANPSTPYQDLIDVMDAVRATPEGEILFDEINFKVPQ